MLSYAEQAAITEYLVSIYDRIELELLENLISAVKKTRYGGATEWRTQMLERMGWYNKKNVAAIAKKTGKTQQEIRKIFKDLGLHALTNEETLYQTAFSRGLLPARPVNLAESAAISQILDAAIANADSYLNLVNTTCAEAARSAYMDVVNKVYIETVTGIKDYSSAIRHAVNNLAKNGLTTVTYYRKDGKKINYPVDAAVRRNIMTSIGQTTGKMQLSRAEEWGCNYMEVTSHFGARPSHAEWQGQVYMINGSSTEYKNLAEATGYGTGEGLKGWNCRHDMYPFIPGISVRGSFPIDLKENEKEYKLTQQQRALEREVRQLRRECVAAENLGDKAEFTNKSMELKDKQTELNNFLEKNKRTQAARVSTAGYNRSVSSKVTWADRKKVQQNVEFQKTLSEKFGITATGFERYRGEQSVLDDLVSTIGKLNKDFPDDVARMILKYENLNDKSTFGQYNPKDKTISLNSQLFNDAEKLKADYKKFVKSGHFPKGTDYKSVIIHEFGHQYDYTHNLSSAKILKSAYHEIYGKYPSAQEIHNMLLSKLSVYSTSIAGKKHTEAIAECFSQWYNSNMKSDICKLIMKEIMG